MQEELRCGIFFDRCKKNKMVVTRNLYLAIIIKPCKIIYGDCKHGYKYCV